jgi:hypothetical protein
MAAADLPLDRLRELLRELPPGARALLIAELERAVMRGDEVPGGDLLLQEVRASVRDGSEIGARIDTPTRAFFHTLEPFLTNAQSDRKIPGRIPRSAVEPIWTWIARDLAPAEAQAYCDEVKRALADSEREPPESIVRPFQTLVAARIRAALDAAKSDDKAKRKITSQIATPNALDDVKDIQLILTSREPLDMIASRLPGHIRSLSDGVLDSVKGLLDSPLCVRNGLQPYALALVHSRLAVSWQLIRLAVKVVDSDDAVRIAASSYALAVTIALADIQRMVEELKSDLQRGEAVAVMALLKCIHDAVRGVRSELDLSADSTWARQLAAIRSEISNLLRSEIESVPGRIRRLLRPRSAQDIVRGSVLDSNEVNETENMIEFVSACRNYAGELAASEVTLRAFHDIQQYLDSGTRALLDALRAAGDHDRPYRRSQMDAAIKFCGKAFGQDYASLLMKAAEIAGHVDRSAAAKA